MSTKRVAKILEKIPEYERAKLACRKLSQNIRWETEEVEGEAKLFFAIIEKAILDAFAPGNMFRQSPSGSKMRTAERWWAIRYLKHDMERMGDDTRCGLSKEYIDWVLKKCGLELDEEV